MSAGIRGEEYFAAEALRLGEIDARIMDFVVQDFDGATMGSSCADIMRSR